MIDRYKLSHAIEYLLVYVVFAAGVLTLLSSNSPLIKAVIIFGLAGVYFIWTIWHHMDDHEGIDFSVFMEYASILVLVVWILFSLS